jgi:hypothetical protein
MKVILTYVHVHGNGVCGARGEAIVFDLLKKACQGLY